MGAAASPVLAAVFALAGCGPSSAPVAPTRAPAANSAPAAPSATLSLPPAPDPAHDPRPDRIKLADFGDRLEKVQADLARVDGALVPRVRSALQAGDEAAARAALAGYRAQIAADVAAQPPPPRLAGCFARAQPLDAKAEAALAAMLSDRQAKAAEVAAVADRPLSLADFGGLAAAITSIAAVDEAKASIAAVRAAADGCRDATPGAGRAVSAAPGAAPTHPRDQSHERISVQLITPPPPPPPEDHPPPPPAKKRGLFERMFGGGS
ncbi:MAG TPA: hypothetical protein VFE13_06905 [Caulobacteraceae bacterium]|nr:hypothetical protein [Caulobacteraceae bacterium]